MPTDIGIILEQKIVYGSIPWLSGNFSSCETLGMFFGSILPQIRDDADNIEIFLLVRNC